MIFGVLNVTPDSFSDGGRYVDPDDAVRHGLRLRAEGADVVDVGGESTRPGAGRVDPAQEIRRVEPVLSRLAAHGVPLSIDTTRSAVASAALTAGACIVNDVSGGLADPDMMRVIADAGCPCVLMHWRGTSDRMNELAVYDDVVTDVRTELSRQVDAALAAGIAADRIVLDPGLGFAKTAAHNWALLAHLESLVSLGLPVLVGASRKAFLGRLLTAPDGEPRPASGREAATVACAVLAVERGAWGLRVHDVQSTADALACVAAISRASS